MRRSFLVTLSVLGAAALLITACGSQSSQQSTATTSADSPTDATAPASASADAGASQITGTVVETVHAATYTYVKIDTGAKEIWAAAPHTEVAVGQQVSFDTSMPMTNFHSDNLDRDFEVVYFVDSLAAGTPGGAVDAHQSMPGHPPIGMGSAATALDLSGIAKAKGGLTIGELYAAKAAMAGKQVTIRGKVVKVNANIMGRHWLHLQDGSGDAAAKTNDLTVTSSTSASVGDLVVVTGAVTLDKDFGAGYRYPVIIEDAQVTIEESAN